MPGQPSPDLPFEWVGGNPALDFTNTVSWTTPERTEERLRSYTDLVRWTGEAGLAGPGEIRSLAGKPRVGPWKPNGLSPGRSSSATRCTKCSAPRPPAPSRTPGRWIASIGSWARRSAGSGLAVDRAGGRGGGTHGKSWSVRSALVAWSAAQLLTSEGLPLLKRCAGDQCGWVFLDRSRNHARRWCDMKVCGNKEKARRFYRRRRGQPLD